jgi:catechol 2,3-dioxygenase-like lactoylglutathione lyase family enzyme
MERSTAWWSTFLGEEPFARGERRAAELDDYVGRVVGYADCDLDVAFWRLPGDTVLELLRYKNPPPGRVDMESCNAGNTHLCLETPDIDADYERMRGLAEFRSAEPVESIEGPYRGARICYLRDPDGISIELIQMPPGGRPFTGG